MSSSSGFTTTSSSGQEVSVMRTPVSENDQSSTNRTYRSEGILSSDDSLIRGGTRTPRERNIGQSTKRKRWTPSLNSQSSSDRSAKYSFDMRTPGFTSSSESSGGSTRTSAMLKSASASSRTGSDSASSRSSGFDSSESGSNETGSGGRSSSGGSSSGSSRHNPLQTPSSSTRRTPRTPRSLQTPLNINTSAIIAIVEGRGQAKGEIGMAFIDLKGFELVLSQFSDGPTYAKVLTKVQIIQPVEIIIPNTACENGNMSSLFGMIKEAFPYVTLTTVQRKYFNETSGLNYIHQLCVPEYNTVEMDVQTKYYSLATAAALLKYVEFIQNIVFAPNSLKITYKGGEQTMLIDASAAVHLELIQNVGDVKSKDFLYGVLNYTKTAGGGRLLRSNILQPPCDISTIMNRYDCIEELVAKEELFLNLQSVLGRFLDVDHLLSTIIQIPKNEGVKAFERKIAEVLYLKHTLELVPVLREALRDGENELFKAYFEPLHDSSFSAIMENIQQVVHDESRYQKGALNMKTQKLFAVKPSVNGLLDVARRAHCEVVDDLTDVIKQVAETSGLPLTSTYNATRGFHIQLNLTGQEHLANMLPPYLIKVVKSKKTISCTTEDIIRYNTRLEESLDEIYFLSNVVISELMKSIVDQIGCLYKLAECVSTLDMLVSFAHAHTLSDWVRPEFTDTLAIKQGRHPILDKMATSVPAVPNDVYASDVSNYIIVTGPNMSGKSTYLRKIALLQVMAQCGCFVPAEYASFKLTNQIFVRCGNDDDMETNCSTFKLEMKEMSYILQNLTEQSLIIVDELGRGTSIEEGVAIAYAISEEILSTKAFTFFATHFHEICELERLYPNVENYHLQVQRIFNRESNTEKIRFSHILAKGPTQEKHYGIELAEISTLPNEIVKHAKEIVEELMEMRRLNGSDESQLKSKQERAVYRLANRLIQTAKNSLLDKEALVFYLKGIKRQYKTDLSSTDP